MSLGSSKDPTDREKTLPYPPSPLYVNVKEESTRGPRYEKLEVVHFSRHPPRIITRIEAESERVSECNQTRAEACLLTAGQVSMDHSTQSLV